MKPSVLVPALVLHLGSWFALLAHGHLWLGAWSKAVEEIAGSVIIVGPLLAGLTANQYARRAETALPMLVVSSVHPVHGWYAAAARLWWVAAANLLLVVGEVAALVAVAGPPLALRPLLVIPLCLLVLALHVLVGMLIGLRLGPRLAGAVAGTCSFGLFLLAVAHLAPIAFVTGGVTGDVVGTQYRGSYLLGVGLVALCTAVALAAPTGWSTRWLSGRLVLALVAVTAAMVLSSGDNVDDVHRFEVVDPVLSCRGSAPEVCLPAEAPRSVAAAARGMHRLAVALREAGATLPDRWVLDWGQRPGARVGMLYLSSGAVLGGKVTDQDLVDSLTAPARCAGFYRDSAPERALRVRWLLGSWIAYRNGIGHLDPGAPKVWFSSQESEAWVRSTYAKLLSCDLDALRLPTVKR